MKNAIFMTIIYDTKYMVVWSIPIICIDPTSIEDMMGSLQEGNRYGYMYNVYLTDTISPLQARCTRYNIMW